jgi:formylglycine-generating enzyme required for sulfatase activity
MAFQDGRWYRIRLRLTQSAIEAWVDDEKVVDFNPAGHKVSLNTPVVCMQPLGLRTWKTATAIRNLRLRRLKAEGAEAPKGGQWKVYTDWPFGAAEAKRRQEETAKALGVKVEQDIDLGGGVKMTLVLIPAGEFMMGSPPTPSPEQLQKLYAGELVWYQGEFPQHRVKITKPFWLGKTEVTQAQWQAVMGNNPSKFAGKPQNPVEMVTWHDCQEFLQKLSARVAQPPAAVGAKAKAPLPQFRLPTDAEWEYACRAGAPIQFYFGDAAQTLGDYAWGGNAGGMTQPVGRKKPNAWGLHDMAGNVYEWCEDWFAPYDKEPQNDPKGPPSGAARVERGGSWYDDDAGPFRCASRYNLLGPSDRRDRGGFRASRPIEVTP